MISAVLLGAGESKRMGVNKLLLPWRRKTVLEHCFETLHQSKVQEVVIVLNIRNKEIVNLFQGLKVKIIVNPYSKKGMSISIRKGLKAIPPSSDGMRTVDRINSWK